MADKRAKTNIFIRAGHQGTVYMHKMEMIRVRYLANNKCFGNPQVMSFELKGTTKTGADGWNIPNYYCPVKIKTQLFTPARATCIVF